MRYVYGITSALLVGGTALALVTQSPVGAQVAQNEKSEIAKVVPRSGAPESFADLVEQLQPAVVNISTKQEVTLGVRLNPFAGTREPITQEQQGGGSGFLISTDGYIVTNNHVISGGPRGEAVNQVTVTLTNQKEYRATIVGRDVASDLALLKIDATGLPFVKFADSSTARVGDWVVAIGNPLGLGSTVTAGIISAVQRNLGQGGAYDRYIQTDTAINRGNSGGPLFDLQGNVVGINNMLISPVGANIGVNFAIPADAAIPVIESLRSGAKIERGYLGIGIAPVDEDLAAALGLAKDRGEFVQRVEPAQAGEKAGLKRGDVVTKVNGKDVTPQQTLSYIVSNTKPGTRIPLEVMRDGKAITLYAVVGTRPPEEELAGNNFDPEEEQTMPEDPTGTADKVVQDELGLAVQPLTSDIARSIGVDAGSKGLVIGAASASSDAGRKGLRRGDVILSANRTPVTSSDALAKIVTDAKKAGRDAVLLEILRRGGPSAFIAVRVKK
ncbi:trypsin-like peptidase domain-containing protein [Sphingopyxis witflariensis]|uniref:Probable periplasmic serine endoprotease DegP-like n=1 Tax=Sphingopyxis witflariensis TaxID=173675 RepID=A0A246JFJ9_9SPHN|nr:trypsin-like peptidase domain-containing protein [Sphingopyxis witflariensis]OWQ91036.1 protease [Sphingopyxis witflariensis]